jgi:sugar phosphate isomerase/epimerase
LTDRLTVGLNPYGLTYSLGLQGDNPDATGVDGFFAFAQEIGARAIEFHGPWLRGADLGALKERLGGRTPLVSAFLGSEEEDALRAAAALGAPVLRLGVSPVLCGDRDAFGAARWAEQIASIRARLPRLGALAGELGLRIGIENHQDFASAELMAFCEEAGESVGITLDTGNAFPVAEAPLDFARTVAPRVVHVHLKDYRVQLTDQGYRLVRCAIGDGAVPLGDVLGLLLADGRELTASLEPGALEARHIRLFTREWWRGYAPKDARDLAAALAAARVNALDEDADHRTPWERGVRGEELIAYEREMLLRSAANVRALGLME